MSERTDAWVLHAGVVVRDGEENAPGALSREPFTLPACADHEALVEPLLGSWEANLNHAIQRHPIDVCRARREPSVVVGNLGVVRVLRPPRVQPSNARVREGDVCMIMPFAKRDRHGYAELVYAYDGPGTIGILARRTVVSAELLLHVPPDSAYSLAQWAAYARYFTAWDNWRVAYRCWQSQLHSPSPGRELVFGWGGGVVVAELELARKAGFRVAMTAGSDQRLSFLRERGITPVDRRQFPDLQFDPATAEDPQQRQRYRAAERQFLATVSDLSDGSGVSIFIDNIGAPLYRATVKALSREGVLATVGWRHGMRITSMRASDCIKRQLHVNTHVWRFEDSPTIRDFQEDTGWIATIDPAAIYDFDGVPQLAEDYEAGKLDTYFPLFRVNES